MSNATADNPLRFIPTDESSTTNTQAEPVDRMPPEVYQAIHQDGRNHAKIYYDRAVAPASHETPFQVRQISVPETLAREVEAELNASVPAATPTVRADSPSDLALVGSALNAIQPDDPPASVRVPDTTPHDTTESAPSADPPVEPAAVASRWQPDQNPPESKPDPQTDNALGQEPAVPFPSATPGVATGLTPTSPQFRKIIERIALSTCLVLCGGVAFILVAKQVFKSKPVDRKPASNSIQIKSQLQLSPKANLFLVETGKHRMIVASDQNGIQSVVALTDSFSETLESFAHEEASDAALAAVPSAADAIQQSASPGKLPPEMYSLATVGQRADRQTSHGQPKSKSHSHSGTQNDQSAATTSPAEAEVRRKMEDALRDRGLKDLLMQSLQVKAA